MEGLPSLITYTNYSNSSIYSQCIPAICNTTVKIETYIAG
jgi:hypothetical protein